MARLPTVDGDSGGWGAILNSFLLVEHNADGTHKVGSGGTFVTRSGTEFMLGGQPFHFTGINMYEALSDGTGNRGCGGDFYTGSALSDALTAIGTPATQGSGRLLRVWFFQKYSLDGSGTRDWSRFDHAITVAKAHGYMLVPVLSNFWSDCESDMPTVAGTYWGGGSSGSTLYRTPAWFQAGYTTIESGRLSSYKAWAQEVAARYANESTIAFWQLMNEAASDAAADATPGVTLLRQFADDVGSAVKAAAPNHLLSLGSIGSGQAGMSGTDYSTVHASSAIDITEYHDYSTNSTTLPGDAWNGLGLRITQSQTLNKPLFIGELGNTLGSSGAETLAARASLFGQKISTYFANGIWGALLWNYARSSSGSGYYDIGAGDRALVVLHQYGSGASGTQGTVNLLQTAAIATMEGTGPSLYTAGSATGTAPTFAADTSTFASGAQCMKVTTVSPAVWWVYPYNPNTDGAVVTEGSSYSAQAAVRVPVGSGITQVRVHVTWQAGTSYLSGVDGSVNTIAAGSGFSIVKFEGAVAPTGATRAIVQVQLGAAATAGDILYIDNVMLNVGVTAATWVSP